jgi:hypothetical protein
VAFEITFSLNMDVELLFVSSAQRVLREEQSKKAQESARELTMHAVPCSENVIGRGCLAPLAPRSTYLPCRRGFVLVYINPGVKEIGSKWRHTYESDTHKYK